MLQVIISPAKQMRVARDAFAPSGIPPFPSRTARLQRALTELERTQGPGALKDLWRVSDKLLAENIERLHGFVPIADADQLDEPEVARAASAAIFSYIGIQYRSMAPEVLDADALSWLQGHLWILSGFYGCARPFDAVEPYRLEMAARLGVDDARDLYAFWGDAIARAVCGDGSAGDDASAPGAAAGGVDIVVNLASVEYAKAVLPHLPEGVQALTCIFGEGLRAGKPVQRATASKIARGSLVRWMAERGVEDVRDLERFDVGYRFSPELSHGADAPGRAGATLVFMSERSA